MTSNVSRWALLSLMLLLVPLGAWADWGALNMTQGVTDLSKEVYTLHMRIFYVCIVIGVAVFAVMIYSMIYHRKSKGVKPATFHESTTVEIIWTVVPLVILIAMAIPAAKVLIKMEDFSDSEMSIKVTAYQWRWQYEYMDSGVSFYSQLDAAHNQARQMGADVDLDEEFTGSLTANTDDGEVYLREVDNELVVPVGKKIRFLHTAADVIHSWWVPALAVKKDAIPGFINENWALINEPGVYRGKCAELCGRDHGFMPIVVRAVTQEEFDVWIAEKQSAMASNAQESERQWSHQELVSAGEKVYESNCMSCHQAEGQGIPGMFPAIAGSGVATGGIDTHIKTVMDGVEDSMMNSFSQVLSDADIAAVITYQRNAFGNGTGDTLQPSHIKSLRDGMDISAPASVASLPEMNSTTGVN